MYDSSPKRQVGDYYRASDRNYKIPHGTSPIMMVGGVSPSDKVNEMIRTEAKLKHFTSRADFILPN